MPYTFNPFTGSFDNTPSVPSVEGVYLPLSGGTVTGNLSVEGNFEVGPSSESVTLFVSGDRVGINTETPNEELTVVGDISATGGLNIGNAGGTSSTLYVENSLVGINTETPNEELTVIGDISASNVIYASGGNSILWNEVFTSYSSNSSTFLTSETDSQTLSFDELTKDLSISNGNTVSLSALVDNTAIDTGVRALTSNWQSTYNTVLANSATNWNYQGTDLKDLSANWQSTYETVSSLSASWAAAEGAYLPLSGGTVTGNLQVSGTTTLSGATEIGSVAGNATLYVGGGRVGIDTETPNEELTVVGDISGSGIIYADGGNSVLWNEAYTNLVSNSAAYLSSVDLSFLSVSANWESTYGTVSALSAAWNAADEVLVAQVTNADSVTLNRGDVVYTFGATGDVMSVKLASNASDNTSATTLGVVNETIIPNGIGYVTVAGRIDKMVFPHPFVDGDALWLGNTPGTFTRVKPVAPEHGVYLGVVERANNGNGIAYIKVQNGYELNELHDVLITSVSAGDALIRNSSNTLWVNTPLSAEQWNSTYTQFSSNSATYVKTVTTTSPGTSAITTIVAVSALPVTQAPGTLYILI